MTRAPNRLKALLLIGAATLYAGAAFADGSDSETQVRGETTVQDGSSVDQRIEDLENQIQDLKRAQAAKFAETKRVQDEQVKVTLDNGRPTFKTADGNFTAALRALIQFDAAYYDDSDLTVANDLSSGTNFRRARFGIEGTAFKNWEYSFIGEFGGSGVEAPKISQASVQYNGWAPVSIIAGAYAPYITLEDSGGAADTIFLERASSVDIVRSIAAGDGRSGVGVTAAGEEYFAHFSYTGGVVGDAEVFDEQQAVLGRAAGLLVNEGTFKVIVGANASYVFDLNEPTAGPSAVEVARFRDRPELRVSGTRLVDTGNINAEDTTHWGVDAGVLFQNFYAEAGYYQFGAERTGVLDSVDFDGWYAQGSWLVTGESRRYDNKRGAFRSPKVDKPLNGGEGSGAGAWEVALRYSTIDLNDNAGNAGAVTPAGGIRGGEQDIWTLGLNWYANSFVRVQTNYQLIDVERLNGAGAQIGGDARALSLRLQFAL